MRVRSLGGEDPLEEATSRLHGNPLQYPCLANPMDRGAWQATVHRVAKELNTTERLTHRLKVFFFLNENYQGTKTSLYVGSPHRVLVDFKFVP